MTIGQFVWELRYLNARIAGAVEDLKQRTHYRVKKGRGQRRSRRNRR